MNSIFGKGQTLCMLEEKENRKFLLKKWMPVIMLCIGAGLIIAGLLIELGVIC